MSHQKISCADMQQFTDVIAGLVHNGLHFDACAITLTIRLTGGY
jgi:hypothetical protein